MREARDSVRVELSLRRALCDEVRRQAARRGMTLASYVRWRVLGDGEAAAEERRMLAQLQADMRAMVTVAAALAAVLDHSTPEERATLERTALELYDRVRGGGGRGGAG
jgi:hypothetical protein